MQANSANRVRKGKGHSTNSDVPIGLEMLCRLGNRGSLGDYPMATTMTAPVSATITDHLVGTPRAHGIDRWIFVGMAAWYIFLALVGFIPDSMMKIGMVQAGLRPPFPLVLHMHAVLMGGFLLFLLSQSWLVATGRASFHRRIGPLGGLLAGALVIVGFVLAPTMYHQVQGGLAVAPPEAHPQIQTLLLRLDNILLLQMQAGILFSLFVVLGLRNRARDPGMHKRLMIFAPAMAMGAAFARMTWLPHTIPDSPLSILACQWLALTPLFVWDVTRNRRIHPAYLLLVALYLPFNLLALSLWDTPFWHDIARWVMA